MNKQSLAQHTPPPWHTGDETKVTGFGPLTAVYAGEVLIASTGGYSDNRADGGEQRARQEADARLIAAAPTVPHKCDSVGCPGYSVLRVLRLALKQHEETDFLGGLGDWLADFMADKAEGVEA